MDQLDSLLVSHEIYEDWVVDVNAMHLINLMSSLNELIASVLGLFVS